MARKQVRFALLLLAAQYFSLRVFSLSPQHHVWELNKCSTCDPISIQNSSRRRVILSSSKVENDAGIEDDDAEVGIEERMGDDDSMDSPLSQLPSEEEEDLFRGPFSRNEKWLEDATEEFLDAERIPIGTLTEDDVQSIVGLMAAWVRRRSVNAALTVEQLLKRVVDDMRNGNRDVFVSNRMYTIAIDAWAKSGAAAGAQRAQNIHDGMIALYKQVGDKKLAPSTVSYNTVMNAWGKCRDSVAIEMAEKVLQDMIEWDQKDARPDAITFSTLMDTYGRSRSPRACSRAEELFDMMVQMGVKRNVYTFSALQNVYARSGRSDAPEKTFGVLLRMLDLSSNGDVFAKPNCVTYNAVLNAYSRTPSKESTKLADEMLRKMELPVENGGYDVEPDRLSYALAILACSRCPDANYGANIAEANLEKMEERAMLEAQKREEVSSAAPPSVSLDVECFNVVLTALSKSRQTNAVSRMLRIIQRMENYAEKGYAKIRPTTRSWNAVLNGLSRSREKGAAEQAERILKHLFGLHEKGIPDSKPDAFTFAAVLSSYQRSATKEAVQRADDIVRQMEQLYESGDLEKPPDVYHYTIVCAAWARSNQKNSAQRCIQILSHMKERQKAGYPDTKPNVRTYNAVLDALSRCCEAEKAEQLLYHMLALSQNGDTGASPDSFSFNAVINAFTRSKLKDAGKRAESVLDRFLEYSEEFPKIKPDLRSFTNIVAYYNRRKHQLDAPYRAEYILNRLVSLYKGGEKHLAPNVFAVTAVMDSYAKHEHPDSGECAERLLRLMYRLKEDFGAKNIEINTGVMNSVLNAWASCGDANAGHRAYSLLEDMEQKSDSGLLELRPNARSYCLVLSAWSKTESPDKAERALAILERMERRYEERKLPSRPGDHPHSLVINACAFTNSGPDAEMNAFKIAIDVMTKISETGYLSPSNVCYGWFIQACGRLKIPDHIKEENLERAFATCRQEGLVDDFVLSRLKGAASEAQLKELLAPALKRIENFDPKKDDIRMKVQINHLPKDWTRKRQKQNTVKR